MTIKLDPDPRYRVDISGGGYIDGVTTFALRDLFDTMALVVSDGALSGAIDWIEMHPKVLARYLCERAAGRAASEDAGVLLGIPIEVHDWLVVEEGTVYATRVFSRDGKVGVLVTREW